MKRIVLFVVLLFPIRSAYAQETKSTPEHTKTVTFSALAMSQDELFSLVTGVRRFIETANRTSTPDAYSLREELELSDDTSSLRLDLANGFQRNDLLSAPKLTTSVRYSYRASAHYNVKDSPALSSVSLSLGDFLRELDVTGGSIEQIDGLAGLVTAQLEQRHSWMAFSSESRAFLGFVLVVMASTLLGSVSFFRLSTKAILLVVGASAVLQLSVYVFPWKQWLPGAAVYSDSVSFAGRNSAMITLVSIVVSLISMAFGVWQMRASSSKLAPAQAKGIKAKKPRTP